ncbi:hypothetical protein PMAYCL1PPCAC_03022, partial [Pristionchus mayeri]
IKCSKFITEFNNKEFYTPLHHSLQLPITMTHRGIISVLKAAVQLRAGNGGTFGLIRAEDSAPAVFGKSSAIERPVHLS